VSIVVVSLTPAQSLGIPVALVGSVFLAVGAELQQHGVTKAGEAAPTASGICATSRFKRRTRLKPYQQSSPVCCYSGPDAGV
jgi:hypothetical protein